MEERIKKSALQAEGIFDYQKLMYPDTGLIAVKIEEEGEELLLTYNLEALTPMTEIRKEDITTRLAVLENIELLAACRKSYYFTLEPENLYYDRNHLVYVKQRDICGETVQLCGLCTGRNAAFKGWHTAKGTAGGIRRRAGQTVGTA